MNKKYRSSNFIFFLILLTNALLLLYVTLRYPYDLIETSTLIRYSSTGLLIVIITIITIYKPITGFQILLGVSIPLILLSQKSLINYKTLEYCGLIIAIIILIKRPVKNKNMVGGVTFFTLFLGWCVVEIFRTDYLVHAIATFLDLVVMFLGIYIVLPRLENNEISKSIFSFVLGVVLTIIWLILTNSWDTFYQSNLRLGQSYGFNPNSIAPWIMMSILFIASSILNKNHNIQYFVLLTILMVGLFFTGTRTSFIATIIGIIFLMLFTQKVKVFTKILITFSLIGVLLGLFRSSNEYLETRYTELFFVFSNPGEIEIFQPSLRYELWRIGIQAFLDNPIVGIGFANFPNYSSVRYILIKSTIDAVNNNQSGQTAHSLYISILSEMGFIGAALFLFWLLRFSYKSLKISQDRGFFLANIFGFLVIGFSGGFFMNFFVGLFLGASSLINLKATVEK